jgi:hypothetical protein
LGGYDDVSAVSGGRNRKHHIALSRESLDLFEEDVLKTEVISHGREIGRVGRKRNGGQRPPIDDHPTYHLGRHVLGVGRRATIAHDEDLAAVLHALAKHFGRSNQIRTVLAHEFLMNSNCLF